MTRNLAICRYDALGPFVPSIKLPLLVQRAPLLRTQHAEGQTFILNKFFVQNDKPGFSERVHIANEASMTMTQMSM